ncbi:Serine proteasec [Hartmannibacter diazotrophicus]|uniref:Serine proteasec n=1 Tax=Hartmannibacter diazotrophicus TaxID=1482074 RepID=A0A2C9D9P1_9HYPH|nr:serine protease [Hartmannibacter diazotrophicus]SON56890.1 Serine proteasec [Hartmannibacter diazotrophicus]
MTFKSKLACLVAAYCLVAPLAAGAANLNDLIGGSSGAASPPASTAKKSPSSSLPLGGVLGGRGTHKLSKDELRAAAHEAVVFVVNFGETKAEDGSIKETLSTGTGFFLDPQTLLTNSHVVDGASMLLVSIAGQTYVKATVLADSHAARNKREDFALLRIEKPLGQSMLEIGEPVESLSDVYAIGFPGVVGKNDQRRADFLQGDLSAVPEVVISSGAVQNVMERSNGVEVVTHSALIHHGNSGGPLINACGQVVGVNTWGAMDNATVIVPGRDQAGNVVAQEGITSVATGFAFAQTVDEIRHFLKSRHQSFQQGAACRD